MAFHIIDSHFHMGQFPEQTHIDRSLESLLAFMDRHCRSMDWEKCPIAKMLYAKYEEEV